MKKLLLSLSILSIILLFLGCTNKFYYEGMEKVGFHKRDIMVSRIEEVQETQKETQKEFKSALEEFKTLVTIKNTNLKKTYEKFNTEYKEAKNVSQELNKKISALEDVSLALFEEWKQELKLYKNQNLKAKSERKLNLTKIKYNKMIKSMKNSKKNIKPILEVLQDNVLILKHSLNAQAISSLKNEFGNLKKEIVILISQMNNSIKQSDEFIKQMP